MADVVVVGGGMIGLSTALLLAGDGHEVTVLERDPAPPPGDIDEAWSSWERRGVNQFRMLHLFLPRFRLVLEAELPEVAKALDDAGALRINPVAAAPAEMTGGVRPGDEDFEILTGRRPVVESATARVAEATAGVTIRRGCAVAGLLTDGESAPGVPHVVGVTLEGGGEHRADVVVDASGRRSPLPRWLAAIGARPPVEEAEDSGFVYYGRHFRAPDGSLPPMLGPGLQHYDSISILTLPADNGTWGIGLVTSAGDAALRALRQPDTWTEAVGRYPLAAHWLAGEPLDEDIAVMAKIEDRYRRLAPDGRPVVTGVLAVADSWACTNPSVGRGASIGLLHAVALRGLLRSTPLDDRLGLALAWDAATEDTVTPWYRSTLWFDRHRLAEMQAQIRGEPYEPDDEMWEFNQSLGAAVMSDHDLLRAALRTVTMLSQIDDEFARPDVVERARALGGGWREAPPMGPTRAELCSLVGA